MICKTCGMDSKTAGTCSWCGALLASPGDMPETTKPERARPIVREEEVLSDAPETPVEIGSVTSLHSLRPESDPAHPTPAPAAAHVTVTSARKMAPPMPPPGGKLRTPAPAMLPPSARSASSATGKLPPLASLSDSPTSAPPPATRAPIASLLDQANAMFTPPVAADAAPIALENGVFPLTSPPKPLALDSPAAVSNDFMKPASAAPTLATAVPETAIGSGVTPAKTAERPASTAPPPITEQQKRAAVNAAMAELVQSPMELLGRYLGVLAVILVGTAILAHLLPRFYIIPMVIAMFVATLLLPVMRVTPWVEEDGEDLALFVILTLLFGPLVSVIIYGVVAMVRQSFNASILGALAVTALLRMVAEVGAGNVASASQLFSMTSPFASLQHVDSGILKLLLRNWSGFAALAGWYAASSFHKEDE